MSKFYAVILCTLVYRVSAAGTNPQESQPWYQSFTNHVSGIGSQVTSSVTNLGYETIGKKLEESIASSISIVPAEFRPVIFGFLKNSIQNAIPFGNYVVPVIDKIAGQYMSSEKLKEVENKISSSTADTTDILLYRLISDNFDEQKITEMVELGRDSVLVKHLIKEYLISLKIIVDAYALNFIANKEDSSEQITKTLRSSSV